MLEASWTALQTDVGKAPDLDALVAAHDAYLRRIADTAFLRPDKARLHGALQAVSADVDEWAGRKATSEGGRIDPGRPALLHLIPPPGQRYPHHNTQHKQVLSMILEFCALHSNLCADAMRHHRTAAPSKCVHIHAHTLASQLRPLSQAGHIHYPSPMLRTRTHTNTHLITPQRTKRTPTQPPRAHCRRAAGLGLLGR